jgi:hypothetical protein
VTIVVMLSPRVYRFLYIHKSCRGVSSRSRMVAVDMVKM